MQYAISDIHGCYDEFMELLQKINFGPGDTLYVLGDTIDRGMDSLKCLRYIMETPNIHMLMGNHEQMMIDALTSDFEKNPEHMANWLENGGVIVLSEFIKLPKDEQSAIVNFLANLPYLAEVKIEEQNYVLVHAGLNVEDVSAPGGAITADVLPRQYTNDLVWIREKFFTKKALPRSITVFGHTPTSIIKKRNGGKVWRDTRWSDKIGIDGGCVYGGSLLALRLDDMVEFAVAKHQSAGCT